MDLKSFFEVFNTIKVDSELITLFSEVLIKKVAINKDKTLLRVYIISDHLIEKKYVTKMEKQIVKQLFSQFETDVKIIEEFKLSGQYNAQTLFDVYNDSILLELKEYNPVLYTLYKKAKLEISDDVVKVLLPKSSIASRTAIELIDILNRIVVERCGLLVDITHECAIEEKKDRSKENEILIAREVAQIAYRAGYTTEATVNINQSIDDIDNNQSVYDENQALADDALLAQYNSYEHEEDALPVETVKPSEEKKDNAKEVKQEKPVFKRPLRRSDNPDLLYGSEFTDEAIPITDIIGDVGETTIKGQIILFVC